jgi:steroid Delta-isomerase
MAMPAAPEAAASRDPVARLVDFFEHLTPERVQQLGDIYSPNVWFKDPFNEVRGLPEVQRIFGHMFVVLEQPRFVVTDSIVGDGQCFLTWNFEFHLKRFDRATLQTIRGASHLKFTADGLIDFHRDYWDAAEELYEKLPVLGTLMRWLKRRANQ